MASQDGLPDDLAGDRGVGMIRVFYPLFNKRFAIQYDENGEALFGPWGGSLVSCFEEKEQRLMESGAQ